MSGLHDVSAFIALSACLIGLVVFSATLALGANLVPATVLGLDGAVITFIALDQ